MYVNMKQMLQEAMAGGYAVGAFNIVNDLTAAAAVTAAEEARSPIILQTSVSTVKQMGPEHLIALLKDIAERATVPVAVHLDHCTDADMVKQCIVLGWSSVMIDMSKASFEENIRATGEIVEIAKMWDATVEGELGSIVGVEDDIVVDEREAGLATPEASEEYVRRTGVSAFAPAIGTAHGLYKGTPNVRFGLFEAIRGRVGSPLVVHGGTGLSDNTFRKLVSLGAAKINISTAIKIAYCEGMAEYSIAHPGENNPLRLDRYATEKVKECVKAHIRIFGSEQKAMGGIS